MAAPSDIDHAFAIPAYGESPYLEACIQSIIGQTRPSKQIVLTSSTPSAFLERIAGQYNLPLLTTGHAPSIASDWNFALSSCGNKYVTVAHQDDMYSPRYLEVMGELLRRQQDTIIAFSNYAEWAGHGARATNANTRIKRLICANAFQGKEVLQSTRQKQRLLKFGNPVCCPSVIFNRARIPGFRFASELRTNLDWEAWARLAGTQGAFCYARELLVWKRVHEQSETTATIATGMREREDRLMFEHFWPAPVASVIMMFYRLGYRANRT